MQHRNPHYYRLVSLLIVHFGLEIDNKYTDPSQACAFTPDNISLLRRQFPWQSASPSSKSKTKSALGSLENTIHAISKKMRLNKLKFNKNITRSRTNQNKCCWRVNSKIARNLRVLLD